MKRTILAIATAAIAATSLNVFAASSDSAVITTTIPPVCGVTVDGSSLEIDATGLASGSSDSGYVDFVLARNTTYSDNIDVDITLIETDVEYISSSDGIDDVWDVTVLRNSSDQSSTFTDTTVGPDNAIQTTVGSASNTDVIKVKLDIMGDDIQKLEGKDQKITVKADVTCI